MKRKSTAGYSDDWARECVEDGNKLLMQRNTSDAINKYDKAIKEYPYYAVAHYNKRIALSMHNNIASDAIEHQEIDTNLLMLNSAKQTSPCFVINIIAAVPTRIFSNDSSDEEPDEAFNALYDQSVKKDSFPLTTTRLNKPKTFKLKSERKITEPELSHVTQDTAESVVVNPLLSNIIENGFEVYDQDKLSNCVVSIGLNSMYSLSTRKNNSLILELNSKVNTSEIKCEKFCYFWQPTWYDRNTGQATPIENVKKFYKKLKRKDPSLAQKFIEKEENEIAERNVPYQDIREHAKNHPKTQELISVGFNSPKLCFVIYYLNGRKQLYT